MAKIDKATGRCKVCPLVKHVVQCLVEHIQHKEEGTKKGICSAYFRKVGLLWKVESFIMLFKQNASPFKW